MKRLFLFIVSLFWAASLIANEQSLVEDREIKKWGYYTISHPESYDYHSVNNLEGELSLKYQLIKSIKPVTGKKDTHYYFTISEECFSSKFKAHKRRLTFGFLDDKDFRLGKVSGNCVRVINAGAKHDTFTEQPRIFRLFNEYMNRISHNKAN